MSSILKIKDENGKIIEILALKGNKGDKGDTGDDGVSIQSIEKTADSLNADVYTITLTNGETSTFRVNHGIGILNIFKTGTGGLVDTYTITLTNLEQYTFSVTNGKNGVDGVGIQGFDYQETIEEDGVTYDVYWMYDTNGEYTEVRIPHGPQGDKGDKGDSYVLTETDKTEIANAVLEALPTWNGGAY